MANRILNDPAAGVNAATYPAQARPDAGDVDVWVAAWQRTGVVSGCAVSQRAAAPNMSVDVAGGTVMVNDVAVTVVGANRSVGAADATFPRVDLVTVHNSGTVAVTPGLPAARPAWPLIPADSAVLAMLTIPPGLGAVTNQEVLDKRVLLATKLRQTVTVAYGPITAGGSVTSTITLATGFRLLSLATSAAARVRLYDRASRATADVSRPIGALPSGDHGLILEYVTTADVLSASLSPEVDGHSMEVPPTAAIPITLTNMTASSATVSVTLGFVGTE